MNEVVDARSSTITAESSTTRSPQSSKRQTLYWSTSRKPPHAVLILLWVPTGLHSVVRRLAFDTESGAFHSLDLINAWFTIPAQIDLDDWYLMHNAPDGRVASIRPGRLPTEQKAGLSVRSTESFDRENRGAQLNLLERHFADVGWEAPRLVRAARNASDFYLESMGQVRLDRWSRGRVVLLGDAGYCPSPLTGLGTSLALVGA
jgi:2-polyprenyl-6-methoxyphenol hydroxylase-like FAD-dependent oxidoreductase